MPVTMKLPILFHFVMSLGNSALLLAADPPAFPEDPAQLLERTSFQTSKPWSPLGNLRSDVAMV
jgi:hypothetical protein